MTRLEELLLAMASGDQITIKRVDADHWHAIKDDGFSREVVVFNDEFDIVSE